MWAEKIAKPKFHFLSFFYSPFSNPPDQLHIMDKWNRDSAQKFSFRFQKTPKDVIKIYENVIFIEDRKKITKSILMYSVLVLYANLPIINSLTKALWSYFPLQGTWWRDCYGLVTLSKSFSTGWWSTTETMSILCSCSYGVCKRVNKTQ